MPDNSDRQPFSILPKFTPEEYRSGRAMDQFCSMLRADQQRQSVLGQEWSDALAGLPEDISNERREEIEAEAKFLGPTTAQSSLDALHGMVNREVRRWASGCADVSNPEIELSHRADLLERNHVLGSLLLRRYRVTQWDRIGPNSMRWAGRQVLYFLIFLDAPGQGAQQFGSKRRISKANADAFLAGDRPTIDRLAKWSSSVAKYPNSFEGI